MLYHAFYKLNLNRIWTGTVATNLGMRRVAEKIGMKEEGCFREGSFVQGEHHDIIMYSILRRGYFDSIMNALKEISNDNTKQEQ